MTPVNFPVPPAGCTHEVRSRVDNGLLFFFNETTGKLYDTQYGEWLNPVWTLDSLSDYARLTTEPLTMELENK